MTERGRVLVIIPVAILGLLLVGNALLYSPRRERLDSLTSRLSRTETTFRDAQEHADALSVMGDYLPDRAQGADDGGQRFLSMLTEEIRNRGLTLNKLQPKEEKEGQEFVKRSYRIDVGGDYAELVDLFQFLEALPDLVIVDSFDLRSRDVSAADEHQMTLNVDVFSY